ncbi:hypothetical protein CLOP_g22381 [Closterium sp. NIES-67]|nr:hypothetical protein CLOP_g22381 [Closterium sp. NIES-67]
MRVAVCGTVGAGKSSLLSCILGEVPKLQGKVFVAGPTAYVPQSAWIQNATIRDNILFGQPLDRPRYQATLQQCALVADLRLFPRGDETQIGERGVNLSGGQKQRIQLARAIAVDAHTGSELFMEFVLKGLAGRSVILVTHQVEFLPAADLILVMKEGRIVQAGRYDQLLAEGTDFSALVEAHTDALESVGTATAAAATTAAAAVAAAADAAAAASASSSAPAPAAAAAAPAAPAAAATAAAAAAAAGASHAASELPPSSSSTPLLPKQPTDSLPSRPPPHPQLRKPSDPNLRKRSAPNLLRKASHAQLRKASDPMLLHTASPESHQILDNMDIGDLGGNSVGVSGAAGAGGGAFGGL